MAAFNINIKKMFNLFTYITTSDRERWSWPLHLSCMQIYANYSGVRWSQLLGVVNYVELDIKSEQSIQRASKSQGGITGQSRMFAVVVESELISDEIMLIQNNCRKLTNVMYRELRNVKAVIFYASVSRLLDFVRAVANETVTLLEFLPKV